MYRFKKSRRYICKSCFKCVCKSMTLRSENVTFPPCVTEHTKHTQKKKTQNKRVNSSYINCTFERETDAITDLENISEGLIRV